jgi:predicted CXXCH cytochrome family protein
MPSALVQLRAARRWRVGAGGVAGLAALVAGAALLAATGCHDQFRASAQRAGNVYPAEPQPPKVIALGTLRGAAAPTQAEVDLTMFMFGAPPPPPLALANPTSIAVHENYALVCDATLDTVYRWELGTDRVSVQALAPPPERPFALDVAPSGELLLCDHRGVWRYSAGGSALNGYQLPDGPFRPGGVVALGERVWVTNVAQHRIEMFTLAGQYVGALGGRDRTTLQFALPRSLARTPDGHVCVVDLLNNRVQVLTTDGSWVRNVGQPGDAPGTFGRPKDVAVAPDGTIFVTDAFSQRVHAFSADGKPLLAFGEPGTGGGALTLPNGVAVTTVKPPPLLPPAAEKAAEAVLAERVPEFYILVAEQLQDPGVRVYGWLPQRADEQPLPAGLGLARKWKPPAPDQVAVDPHWNGQRCTACHQMDAGRLLPLAAARVDELCLSCHDGRKAPADPHPIGRPAQTELVATPATWPTVNGTIGCLTCHDIQRHCAPTARRTTEDYALLRGYDPQHPQAYCTLCHKTEVGGGRFSPHRQRDAAGNIRRDACLFCHTAAPPVPPDGRRHFEPHLRVASSELCRNCHTPHWDLSPRGHVDRPVTPRIREWMLMREVSAADPQASPEEVQRRADALQRDPARLPLGEGKVTCYSCHNPHYLGLFPPDTELGTLATNPADRQAGLRTNWIDLCTECHRR